MIGALFFAFVIGQVPPNTALAVNEIDVRVNYLDTSEKDVEKMKFYGKDSVSFNILKEITKVYDPWDVGHSVSFNLIAKGEGNYFRSSRDSTLHYAEIYTANAAIRFARITGNDSLFQALQDRYEAFMNDKSDLVRQEAHGFYRSAFLLLEFYKYTGDLKYYQKALERVKEQRAKWNDVEYPDSYGRIRMTDGAFLTAVVETELYNLTNDSSEKYICVDRAARLLNAQIDKLQRKDGLFDHASNSKVTWSRGNGWIAYALTEGLVYIPETHPMKQKIMDAYLKFMDALIEHQTDDGLWCQVINRPEAKNNFKETSGTAMFMYSLLTGIKEGWLNPNVYGPATLDTWKALVQKLTEDGSLKNVSKGLWPNRYSKHYLNHDRIATGDMHGQSALLWCADLLIEYSMQNP